MFELVHSNVWGSAPVISYHDYRYYVIFIDDFLKTTWLYLMKNKSEIFSSHFLIFINLVETQYNKKIKILRTDNGTKFINQSFSNFTNSFTKLFVFTPPQQNGISERKNHHLLEMI
jgi:hypothetical protein